MHYEYRWWYAGGICLMSSLCFYYGMIAPEQNELTQLAAVAKQSAEQLLVLKEFALQEKADIHSVASLPINKMDFFALLPAIAHQQGVAIQSLKMLTGSEQILNEMQIRMRVEGEFSALLHFAMALMTQQQPIFIRHFSFQTSESQTLLLSLDLLMMKNNVAMFQPHHSPINLSLSHNPFCNTPTVPEQDTATLALTPLSQLTMHGFLQLGQRKQALLALPTGVVVAVEVGSVVGKEKAVVKEIHRDSLVVEMGAARRKILLGGKYDR